MRIGASKPLECYRNALIQHGYGFYCFALLSFVLPGIALNYCSALSCLASHMCCMVLQCFAVFPAMFRASSVMFRVFSVVFRAFPVVLRVLSVVVRMFSGACGQFPAADALVQITCDARKHTKNSLPLRPSCHLTGFSRAIAQISTAHVWSSTP